MADQAPYTPTFLRTVEACATQPTSGKQRRRRRGGVTCSLLAFATLTGLLLRRIRTIAIQQNGRHTQGVSSWLWQRRISKPKLILLSAPRCSGWNRYPLPLCTHPVDNHGV